MAYGLALLPELSHVHSVFHVSILRRYMWDNSHVLKYIPLDIRDDLSYTEQLIMIFYHKEQLLHTNEEATWEEEDDMRSKYPHLFSNLGMCKFID